uniref:Uncharacterized protein n=1 Tax=Pithovirus LCPAC403 TaxID=2506596 RepID=A0A481ZBR5_9VIRU|nr:MAG: hypothetical protein LCPAC403_00490 [Pithovirus LCPAC403]
MKRRRVAQKHLKYVTTLDGKFGTLSSNKKLICYLYKNDDLVDVKPTYAGIRSITIIDGRFIYGLCHDGGGTPFLEKFLDTEKLSTFTLSEGKLLSYSKQVDFNKILALATHPLVIKYVEECRPDGLIVNILMIGEEIKSFTSEGVTINILIKGRNLTQLN